MKGLKEKMAAHMAAAKEKAKNAPPKPPEPKIEDLPREEREALFVQARDSFIEFAKQHLEPWVPYPADPAAQILVELYGKENLFTKPHYYNGNWVIVLVPEVFQPPEWDGSLNRCIDLLTDAQKPSLYDRISEETRQALIEAGVPEPKCKLDFRFNECIPYFSGVFRTEGHGYDPYGYEEVEFRFSRLSQEFRSRWIAHKMRVQKEGQIPVVRALREGSFNDCPSMGRKRNYPDPTILYKEGVVVPYNGAHYRLKFNWDALEDRDNPGLQSNAPDVLSHVSFEKTTDPLTKQGKGESWSTHLQVFGKGTSQQDDIAPSLDDKLPACLAVFEYGHDFTWTLMAHLDDEGLPKVAWLEGSCT